MSPELHALARRFDQLSTGFTTDAERKLEIARVLGDRQAVVTEQIKIQVMRAARKMFDGSYREAVGS